MAKKEKKVKEERLEDILWACREHLRGKAEMRCGLMRPFVHWECGNEDAAYAD